MLLFFSRNCAHNFPQSFASSPLFFVPSLLFSREWVDGAVDAKPVLSPQGGVDVAQSRAQSIPHTVRKWPPFFPHRRIICLYRYVADETFPSRWAPERERERPLPETPLNATLRYRIRPKHFLQPLSQRFCRLCASFIQSESVGPLAP